MNYIDKSLLIHEQNLQHLETSMEEHALQVTSYQGSGH